MRARSLCVISDGSRHQLPVQFPLMQHSLLSLASQYAAVIERYKIETSRRHLLVGKITTIAYLESKFQFSRPSFDKCKLKMVRNVFFF